MWKRYVVYLIFIKCQLFKVFFWLKISSFFLYPNVSCVLFRYIDAAEFSLKILELFNRGYLRECAKYANLSHLCVRNRFSRSNGNILLPLNVHHLSCLMITITISTLSSFIWAFIICSLTFRWIFLFSLTTTITPECFFFVFVFLFPESVGRTSYIRFIRPITPIQKKKKKNLSCLPFHANHAPTHN